MRRLRPVLVLSMLAFTLLAPIPPALGVPPSNDAFSSATVIGSLPFEDNVSTAEATLEANEPPSACAFDETKTVWYSFTPVSSITVASDTVGSDFDTVLSVWKGTSLADLELIACSDDSVTGLTSKVHFRARSSTTYYIRVAGFARTGGSLTLRMRESLAGVVEGTVTDEESGLPLPSMCVEAINQDFDMGFFSATRSDGSYDIVVTPGQYVIRFIDFCDSSSNYRTEWYDDATSEAAATPVVIDPQEVETVDEELELGCAGWAFFGDAHQIGTPGPDILTGTPARDVLCGLGGEDTLNGLESRDVLLGGESSDVLTGGEGNDDLIGGASSDVLTDGDGNDNLFGNSGADALTGGEGNDLLHGGDGRDRCRGGPGRDRARSCEITRGIP